MSTTPQAFYLRLNNHQGFMTGALADLYSEQLMVDVTLTAEGQLIRAHKIVLSACSPYFKHILLQFHSSSQYPVIILKDIPFSDLKAIIEFIYRGEITVPHHQLESILSNGAVLQIKGLSEVNKKKVYTDNNDNVSVVGKDDNDNDKGSDKSDKSDKGYAAHNQIKQIKTNKKNKLRKSSTKEKIGSNQESCAASNGDDGGSGGDISSLDDTNDGTHANVDDFRTDANFMQTSFSSINSINSSSSSGSSSSTGSGSGSGGCGTSNNQTGNKQQKDRKSQTISSFMANDKKNEKLMTEYENNNTVVPFNLLEQSMMIDVKQDVNINAQKPNRKLTSIPNNINSSSENSNLIDFNKDNNDDDTDEADGSSAVHVHHHNDDDDDGDGDTEQEDNHKVKQCTHEHPFDSIPLALTTPRAAKLSMKYSNAKKASNSAKLRISKAGIPRKGTSVRSQKKYKCPVCYKIYVSPQNMKEHLRNTHTNPNQKYVCSQCDKEYSWKHALDRHFKSKHR